MAPARTLLLSVVLLACSPRADAPARAASQAEQAPRAPAPSAPHAEPGVSPRDGGEGADGGSCPAGQQRCCDGQCDTPEACVVLACDPAPRPKAETR